MKSNFKNETSINFNNINLCVNPALECLGVVFIVSKFGLNKIRTNEKYVQLVCKHFSKFENHELITKFKQLTQNNAFKYDAPLELMLNIFYNKKPSKELMQRSNLNLKEFNKLKQLVNTFIAETKFNEFFESNKNYYTQQLNLFKCDMLKFSPSKYLFNFLGLSSKRLNIALMFGITTSNYGITVNKNLYCCVRPFKESRTEHEIDFSCNKVYTTTLILHEFAHHFINPLTAKFGFAVKQIDENKFKSAFDKNAYGTHKETVVNESVIRAIECKFVEDSFGKAEYDEIKQDYLNDGFEYIPKLEELYKIYLTQRNKFKNMKKFYPQIIDMFLNN